MINYNRPYVESSVWIAYIKGESRDDGKHDCKEAFDAILEAAEEGRFQIFTSTLTIAEVCRRKDAEKLTETENEDLTPYFREKFIVVVEVDRDIAERANALCRLHLKDDETPALRPNDAVHLACAERAGCEVLLAYDKHLTRWQHETIRSEWPDGAPKAPTPAVAIPAELPPVQYLLLPAPVNEDPASETQLNDVQARAEEKPKTTAEDEVEKEKEPNVFKAPGSSFTLSKDAHEAQRQS